MHILYIACLGTHQADVHLSDVHYSGGSPHPNRWSPAVQLDSDIIILKMVEGEIELAHIASIHYLAVHHNRPDRFVQLRIQQQQCFSNQGWSDLL